MSYANEVEEPSPGGARVLWWGEAGGWLRGRRGAAAVPLGSARIAA